MNKILLCIGLLAMVNTAILPKNIDPNTVVEFNSGELVVCVKSVKCISETDRILMAKLLYLECRGESAQCQSGVCSVIYNRYRSGKYRCMEDVIYEESQFASENVGDVPQDELGDLLRIVDDVVDNGPTLPPYTIYFKASEYHTFSDAENLLKIDNTCFSYSKELYEKYGDRLLNDTD